jgi:phosphatidylglycerophosphate synthase
MYKKILFIDTDKLYSDYLVSKLKFLKHIHPNVITFFGIFINVLIYYSLDLKFLVPLLFLLFLRYLTDCLDGAVARMYKKASKLGGYLDTISDHMLIFIVSLFVFEVFSFDYYILFSIILTLISLSYLFIIKSLSDHRNIKVKGKNFYNFLVNNSWILYLCFYIFFIFNNALL